MILIDANILVYAFIPSSPQHARAKAWLEARLNAETAVGLPWPSLLAFVRLVSNPRVFEHPATVAEAWQRVEEWLDRPCAWIPLPTERHREILGRLLKSHASQSNLVPDADLAALALEHGLTLCSTDGDFARFKGVTWENPIAS